MDGHINFFPFKYILFSLLFSSTETGREKDVKGYLCYKTILCRKVVVDV